MLLQVPPASIGGPPATIANDSQFSGKQEIDEVTNQSQLNISIRKSSPQSVFRKDGQWSSGSGMESISRTVRPTELMIVLPVIIMF